MRAFAAFPCRLRILFPAPFPHPGHSRFTSLAAIAAFVDPGLNKSADCRALLTDAKAMGAPLHAAAARPGIKK